MDYTLDIMPDGNFDLDQYTHGTMANDAKESTLIQRQNTNITGINNV